jgi:hypothetical protein
MDRVQADDSGRTIDLASAPVDELRQAYWYHWEIADRLRLDAAERPREDSARESALQEERQHRRVAVSVYDAIQERGGSLC